MIACGHADAKKFGRDRKGNQRFRCLMCGKTWTEQPVKPIGNLRMDMDKAVAVLTALAEGCSVRSTARMFKVRKNAVIDLMVLVGERCQRFLESRIVDVPVEVVEADEIWSFVGAKQSTCDRKKFGPEKGTHFCYTAIERHSKLLICWHFGWRSTESATVFVGKLDRATSGTFTLSTDGMTGYYDAVTKQIGGRVHYGQIVKIFQGERSNKAEAKYSPGSIKQIKKTVCCGWPSEKEISTSICERQNLNIRTFCRRMTRLTNAFSKKLANHEAAMAFYFAHYNFVRKHGTIKTTPAVKAGLTDHQWTMEELLAAAATQT